jgi:hypothetical protein
MTDQITFVCTHPENRAYEATKAGKWARKSHRCGVWIETRPIGIALARKLLAEFKPNKQVPRCGEVAILSERTDKWHVELVNRGQYLHLQRWEY